MSKNVKDNYDETETIGPMRSPEVYHDCLVASYEELYAAAIALREAAYRAMVSAQDEESADAYATLRKALEESVKIK